MKKNQENNKIRKTTKLFGHILVFIFLTITTQIGGSLYVLSLILGKWRNLSRGLTLTCFVALYSISTFLIIPNIAPYFGREKVVTTENIQPTNYTTVLLNRNYVKPELNALLLVTEKHLKGSGVEIRFLDANFPFVNGFPLLPHLSHKDGKKLDLSLVYESKKGKISNQVKSRSGYGVFEDPKIDEFDQVEKCIDLGYFQYDYPKYLTFGSINNDLVFSKKGTKHLITALLKSNNLGKMFIEPHLKSRLGLSDNRVKYHGCRAVRHDDHIHIQLK